MRVLRALGATRKGSHIIKKVVLVAKSVRCESCISLDVNKRISESVYKKKLDNLRGDFVFDVEGDALGRGRVRRSFWSTS